MNNDNFLSLDRLVEFGSGNVDGTSDGQRHERKHAEHVCTRFDKDDFCNTIAYNYLCGNRRKFHRATK